MAAFTQECPNESGTGQTAGAGGASGPGAAGGAVGPLLSFEDRKRAYLDELSNPGSCHLREGIEAKTAPLGSLAQYRERWNQMIRGQSYGEDVFSPAEWATLEPAIDDELRSVAYHGTATTSTLAHDNPGVRLVVIERPLGDAQTFQKDCSVQI
jgi:hypothetical protein